MCLNVVNSIISQYFKCSKPRKVCRGQFLSNPLNLAMRKKKQHYCNFNIGNNIENVQSNDVLSAGKNLPKMWMSQKAISEKRCKDQISVVAQKPL